eukprot:5654400-Heterocapsa_arctica.AAC.1
MATDSKQDTQLPRDAPVSPGDPRLSGSGEPPRIKNRACIRNQSKKMLDALVHLIEDPVALGL